MCDEGAKMMVNAGAILGGQIGMNKPVKQPLRVELMITEVENGYVVNKTNKGTDYNYKQYVFSNRHDAVEYMIKLCKAL